MKSIRAGRADKLLAIVLGAAGLGFLYGSLGAYTGNEWPGGVSGVILGGLLGWGAVTERISPVIVGAAAFGVYGSAMGPGFDDYGGRFGLITAPVGGLIAAVFWRRPRWLWKRLARLNGDEDRYREVIEP